MTHTLILGGRGKTGRRVAALLRAAGLPARTASRTGSDVVFDLGDPATWARALDGCTAAYLIEPAMQSDAAGRQRVPRFVDAAVAAGVRRVVLLSAPAADRAEHPLHPAEQAVRGAGVSWTILRPNWFAQNFSEDFWLPGVRAGALHLPTGDGRTPFVDADDIAEVAVRALTGDDHAGRTYELTGPRAIGFGEAAALIGAASGRTVEHVDIDPAAFVERQVGIGVPVATARLLTGILADLRNGGLGSTPTDDVAAALGRPARTFEDFVTATAATGVWNPQPAAR